MGGGSMATSRGLENEIVAAIRRIMRAVELRSRELLEQCGLTGPQLLVLQAVTELKKASVTAIARAVHIGPPTVTRILARLEKRGFVERTRSDSDRRTVYTVATERGREVLARAPSLLQDQFRDELARLEDWKQTGLLSSLQQIAAMMDAESLPAAPVLSAGPIAPTNEGTGERATSEVLSAEETEDRADEED
jgi:DNA-binding MarR family transcriptional regulator